MSAQSFPGNQEGLQQAADYWLRLADRTSDPHWKSVLEGHAAMILGTSERLDVAAYEAVEIAPDRWRVTRWFKDRHTDSQVVHYDLPDNINRTRVEGAIDAAIVSSHRFAPSSETRPSNEGER
jgi:hypothetical protein